MPHESPEADAGMPQAVPPRQVLAEELASIRDLAARASAFVALPEPSVLVDDVRSRPPNERFESVAVEHAERFGIDDLTAEGVHALADDVPVADPVERATSFLVRRAGRLQGRHLGNLTRNLERPREHLVLAVAAGHLQRATADCQVAADVTPDESAGRAGDLAHHASIVLSLTAALYAVAADGLGPPTEREPHDATTSEPLPDSFLREVALADHHRTLARGDDPAMNPLDRDRDDLEHLLVVQGSLLAISELDADPHALADLADVPLEHLVGVLASE